MNALIKKPSAWLPVVLSLGVLGIMLISFAMFGIPVREKDEGAGAHLFQIWLVLEVAMMAFFAMKWLVLKPKQTLLVLAIQIAAVLAACAPVFYFKL